MMRLRLGTLRKLLKETHDPQDVFNSFFQKLLKTKPNSSSRKRMSYELVNNVDVSSKHNALLDALCLFYDISREQYDLAQQARAECVSQHGPFSEKALNASAHAIDSEDLLVDHLIELNLTLFLDHLAKQAGNGASHIDWRPDTAIPEDYYAL